MLPAALREELTNVGTKAGFDSVGIRTFGPVLEDFAGIRVDADLVGLPFAFHVEGIAQAAAAGFFLEFLIGDLAGAGFGDNRARACSSVTLASLEYCSPV